jgi:hypothetical protein
MANMSIKKYIYLTVKQYIVILLTTILFTLNIQATTNCDDLVTEIKAMAIRHMENSEKRYRCLYNFPKFVLSESTIKK